MEEQNKETEIRLQDLWLVLKRCWWLMLIAMIIVAVAVYCVLSFTHEDEYTATTSIYVLRDTTASEGSTNLGTSDITIANSLINDCNVLLKSHDHVLAPVMVAQNLDGLLTIGQFENMINIENKDDTRVLYLSVTSTSAQRSADIANALAEQACTYFNDLYNQNILNIVDQAPVRATPSNPISMMTVMLVALVAAVAVYAIFFLKFILDDKINSGEDVEKHLGLSVLGVIPNKFDSSRRKSKYGYYYSSTADGEKKRQ